MSEIPMYPNDICDGCGKTMGLLIGQLCIGCLERERDQLRARVAELEENAAVAGWGLARSPAGLETLRQYRQRLIELEARATDNAKLAQTSAGALAAAEARIAELEAEVARLRAGAVDYLPEQGADVVPMLLDAPSENAKLEQVMPIVDGKHYRCTCGANVFSRLGPNRLSCNGCPATYTHG